VPEKGFRRLFPGNKARLKYGYIVECTGCDKDENGKVIAVHCTYLPDTKSGTPGADSVKVKGNLHWVSAAHAYPAEVRLYDRLFSVPPRRPARRRCAGVERDFLDDLNPVRRSSPPCSNPR
jgi:glutaminyl-tRNA synthetase